MRVITITNQKGGVGKTILSFHLAKYLGGEGEEVVFHKMETAKDGKRKKVVSLQRVLPNFKVLYIDSDGQGDGSSVFAEECFTGTYTFDLFAADTELVASERSVTVIKGDQRMTDIHTLDATSAGNNFFSNLRKCDDVFDYVVIDTPPTENIAVRSIMLVSDYVIAPIVPVQFSISGITKVLQLVFGIKKQIDKMKEKQPNLPLGKLEFLGMVASKFLGKVDSVNNQDTSTAIRLKSQETSLAELAKNYGKMMLLDSEGRLTGISERQTIEQSVLKKGAVWENKGTDALASTQDFFSVFDAIEHKIGGF